MITESRPNIEIDFTDDRLTGSAGLVFVSTLARRFGLMARLCKNVTLKNVSEIVPIIRYLVRSVAKLTRSGRYYTRRLRQHLFRLGWIIHASYRLEIK